MSRLFLPKLAHPLADEKERQRVLGELAGAETLSALEQSTHWLKSLADSEGMAFPLRATLIRQIDDVAQRPARIIGREYLTMAHLSEEDDLRLWRTSRAFWTRLGATYNACLSDFSRSAERPEDSRAELTRVAVRLIRAYGTRLKWDQFRYWPASEVLWQNIGRTYLYAFDNGFVRREVSAYPGERIQTTVEQEYLRVLVFHASSMDSLLPFEVEIAERLISHFLPRFSISPHGRDRCTHWVDPELRRAPSRLVAKLDQSRSRFYFSTIEAVEPLRDMQRMLERGRVPDEIDLARYRSPRILLPIVRHLAAHWGGQRPQREHDRYRVRSKLTVVSGIEDICRCLATGDPPPLVKSWTVENVSQGGFRAGLPLAAEDQLRIGSLLGMRPEGGENWLVGVLRRLARTGETRAVAGVETLSRKPIVVTVEAENGDVALMLDPPETGETVRMVVTALAYGPAKTLRCGVLGTALVLDPVELLERGVEFDLVRYRVTEPV